ncbi:hypothetical protein BH11PAT1_BH11PAT1_0760 [soil metagenome]
MRAGYPLVVILKHDRNKYYRALDTADKGDAISFMKFIAQAVERSLDIYLQTLSPKIEQREQVSSLAQISKVTPYTTKYLNLLARLGKLEAHKQGRGRYPINCTHSLTNN